MTREELSKSLLDFGFSYWRNEEYHRDEFRGMYKSVDTEVEVMIDYYTVRVVWYYEKGKKVSKSYRISTEVVRFHSFDDLFDDFLSHCSGFYKIDVDKLIKK